MPSLKKVIWALLNNVVDLMIGIGLLVIVTRFYSTDDAGKWILFTTIFFLITRIREGAIQTALNKSGSGVSEERRYDVYKLNLSVNLGLEIVVSLIIYLLGWLGIPGSLKEFFLLYPLGAIPWAIYRWQVYAHLLTHEVVTIFRGNILVFLVLVITTGLIFYEKAPVENLVYVLAFAGTAGSLYGVGAIGFRKLWKATIRKEDVKVIMHYGGHGALRGFTGNIANRINVFLTAGLLTMTDTAIYGVAQKYIHLILMPNSAIQSLIFPKFCEAANLGQKDVLRELFEKTVSSLMGFFLIIIIVVAVLAYEVVPLVNGPQYIQSIPLILAILMMSSITAPFGNAFGSCINAIGKPEVNTYLLIVVSIVNIIASYIFISNFGLWGTILGPFVAEAVSLIWTSVILKREVQISYKKCFSLVPVSYKVAIHKANNAYNDYIGKKR
ncbi:oligosaccharide flippase family protein [Limibacter armeniacum]|uniref:lipopolysaccharide biosynthesis protein n=1 Tax=Limibacter armeniacum TaxID=466084 RepID=UPI002FE6AE0C